MPGISKDQSNEVQRAAMEVVTLFGVTNLDQLSVEAANLQRAAMYRELMNRTAVSWPTARRHIVRACRRQRHPDWQPPAEWGGSRPKQRESDTRGGKRRGAGAKKKVNDLR